jgi:hypothetical protein
MFKKMMINWMLPLVVDRAIEALQSLARKSGNDIDDNIVAEVKRNKQKLIDEIKATL